MYKVCTYDKQGYLKKVIPCNSIKEVDEICKQEVEKGNVSPTVWKDGRYVLGYS